MLKAVVTTDVINTGLQSDDEDAWPAESCLNSFSVGMREDGPA